MFSRMCFHYAFAGKEPHLEVLNDQLFLFFSYLIIVLIYVGITMVDIFDPALFGIPAATYTYINT